MFKKLNNKGWGMSEMMFFWALLAFFLLIAIFYIYKWYDAFDIDHKHLDQYELLEMKAESAANKYVLQNSFEEDTNTIRVSLDELINSGYLEDIRDVEDNTLCEGYVEVSIDDSISSKGYISCSNYETKGY